MHHNIMRVVRASCIKRTSSSSDARNLFLSKGTMDERLLSTKDIRVRCHPCNNVPHHLLPRPACQYPYIVLVQRQNTPKRATSNSQCCGETKDITFWEVVYSSHRIKTTSITARARLVRVTLTRTKLYYKLYFEINKEAMSNQYINNKFSKCTIMTPLHVTHVLHINQNQAT